MENLLLVLLVIAILLIAVIIYSQLSTKTQVYVGNVRWYITSMVENDEIVSPFYPTEEEARAEFEAMKETEYDMHLYSAVVCFDNGEAEIQDDEVIDAYWDEENSN